MKEKRDKRFYPQIDRYDVEMIEARYEGYDENGNIILIGEKYPRFVTGRTGDFCKYSELEKARQELDDLVQRSVEKGYLDDIAILKLPKKLLNVLRKNRINAVSVLLQAEGDFNWIRGLGPKGREDLREHMKAFKNG